MGLKAQITEFPGVLKKYYVHAEHPGVIKKNEEFPRSVTQISGIFRGAAFCCQ